MSTMEGSRPNHKNGYATPEMWAESRPLITRLYKDENKTLKQVMTIMKPLGFLGTWVALIMLEHLDYY